MGANVTRSFYAPEHLDETLGTVLSLVGEALPSGGQGWTEMERLLVYDWAIREHLHASDNPVRRRPRPSLLGPRA